MEKKALTSFIQKYQLNGAANSVKLISDGQNLSTTFITEEKNVVGMIKTSLFPIESGEYCIYDTDKLLSLLGVLGEDIRLKVNKHKDLGLSIVFSDGVSKAIFILSDPVTIPEAPKSMKTSPTYNLKVKLTPSFITTFIKAKGALPEAETFVISSSDTQAQIVIGQQNIESNRVAFEVESVELKAFGETHFSAKYMRDILYANREAKGGLLEVSSQGIAHVTFELENCVAEYYMMKVEVE